VFKVGDLVEWNKCEGQGFYRLMTGLGIIIKIDYNNKMPFIVFWSKLKQALPNSPLYVVKLNK
jgi:hypothetical protein